MTKLDDEQSEGAPGDLAPDAPPVESGSKVDPGLESLSKYGNQVEVRFAASRLLEAKLANFKSCC